MGVCRVSRVFVNSSRWIRSFRPWGRRPKRPREARDGARDAFTLLGLVHGDVVLPPVAVAAAVERALRHPLPHLLPSCFVLHWLDYSFGICLCGSYFCCSLLLQGLVLGLHLCQVLLWC